MRDLAPPRGGVGSRRPKPHSALLLPWLLLTATGAYAQKPAEPGLAPNALPGVEDVGAPTLGTADQAVVAGLDYGHVGTVSGAGTDGYDRVGFDLAAALRVHDAVAVAWHTRARADLQGGGFGGVSAASEITARFAPTPGTTDQALRVGGETSLRLPAAANLGDMFSGLGVRLLGQVGYLPTPRLQLLGQLGFTLDRAAFALPDVDERAAVDRVSLGVSDSNAVPLGLAAVYDLGGVNLLGEWSYDLRVGRRAPRASQSTMWWRAGVRLPLSGGMTLGLLAGVNSAARPTLQTPGAPHDIAPRFALSARLALPFGPAAGPRAPTKPEGIAPPAATPATADGLDFETTIRDRDGKPVPAAKVTLSRDGASRDMVADDQGAVRFLRVPVGDWQLRAEAEGFEPVETVVSLRPGTPPPAALQLSPALPEGQIRGTVRAFSGAPLRATVTVAPLGTRVRADEHGEFRVDVPPGQYTVEVSAPGYTTQQRPAQVEERGVTVLIVDLRRQP